MKDGGDDNGGEASPQVANQAGGGTWDTGSDISGSNVSSSSVWSTDSGTTGDRSSRRALILQMAKARMRNNKESPTKAGSSVLAATGKPTILEEETASINGFTETNTDIDFTNDLD